MTQPRNIIDRVVTCSHGIYLNLPCGACSEQMSTKDRFELCRQRAVDLSIRGIRNTYAMREYTLLVERFLAEHKDDFAEGDVVSWNGEYEPKSFMGQYGMGPFTVANVRPSARYCLCRDAHHGENPGNVCPCQSTPAHPQSVAVNDMCGRFMGILSGSHLKVMHKVVK